MRTDRTRAVSWRLRLSWKVMSIGFVTTVHHHFQTRKEREFKGVRLVAFLEPAPSRVPDSRIVQAGNLTDRSGGLRRTTARDPAYDPSRNREEAGVGLEVIKPVGHVRSVDERKVGRLSSFERADLLLQANGLGGVDRRALERLRGCHALERAGQGQRQRQMV